MSVRELGERIEISVLPEEKSLAQKSRPNAGCRPSQGTSLPTRRYPRRQEGASAVLLGDPRRRGRDVGRGLSPMTTRPTPTKPSWRPSAPGSTTKSCPPGREPAVTAPTLFPGQVVGETCRAERALAARALGYLPSPHGSKREVPSSCSIPPCAPNKTRWSCSNGVGWGPTRSPATGFCT